MSIFVTLTLGLKRACSLFGIALRIQFTLSGFEVDQVKLRFYLLSHLGDTSVFS